MPRGSNSFIGIVFDQQPVVGGFERIKSYHSDSKTRTPVTWNSSELEGAVQKNSQTYYRRDLRDGGYQKPNETLTNRNSHW
jgi:hypothetical protein